MLVGPCGLSHLPADSLPCVPAPRSHPASHPSPFPPPGKCIKDLKSLGSDGWFYNLNAAAATTLRDIIHDGFLHPKQNKCAGGRAGARARGRAESAHRFAGPGAPPRS